MKKLVLFLLLTAAAAAGWFARSLHSPEPVVPASSKHRILYYQSPMHPWIKSDKPGKCTICGMDLTPVYEGAQGPATAGLVTLSPASISVIDVQTSPVVRQPLRRTLRVAGTVDDDASRHRVLSAYAEGRLDTLFVNYDGAEVIAGQPLALIYSPPLLAAVREYLTFARGNDAGSPLLVAAAQRLVQFGLSEAQIARLPATFAETNLHVELLAPISGTVVSRSVAAGQTVTQGQSLFELADFSTMWFQFIAYERDLPWLQPGQQVEVSVPSLPGIVFTNAIAFIDPNFDELTRSTKVRVPLSNPLIESNGRKHRLFQHRLYGTAAVNLVFPEVLTVPRSAVLDPGGRAIVFVESGNGSYQPRLVKLGRWGDTDCEIVEGVSEGDRVVTNGALLLDAQAQINAVAAGAGSTNGPASALETLTPPQLAALRAVVYSASDLSRALADDNLAVFNGVASKFHALAPGLDDSLRAAPGWRVLAAPLRTASHLEPAPDLAAARQEFYALMQAAVPLAQRLRKTGPEFTALKVYRCPMTKSAFPGAPAKADWLQTTLPLRNPYLGAEMPDCGAEVAP